MEEKPSTEEVLSAISALYNNPDKSEKERASKWLLELQKSVRHLLQITLYIPNIIRVQF